MSNNSIDMAFIARLEGGAAVRGYVPDAANSRSGVTIGTGFDLGQRNKADLQRLNLPENLCQRLEPYLGLIGQAAQARLKACPLTISSQEAQLIDDAYKAPFIERLATAYSKAAGQDFASLPGAVQTVIASVAFQYGDLASRTPRFWAQVVAGDWKGAENNLRNFGDRYPARRTREADLLGTVLV